MSANSQPSVRKLPLSKITSRNIPSSGLIPKHDILCCVLCACVHSLETRLSNRQDTSIQSKNHQKWLIFSLISSTLQLPNKNFTFWKKKLLNFFRYLKFTVAERHRKRENFPCTSSLPRMAVVQWLVLAKARSRELHPGAPQGHGRQGPKHSGCHLCLPSLIGKKLYRSRAVRVQTGVLCWMPVL